MRCARWRRWSFPAATRAATPSTPGAPWPPAVARACAKPPPVSTQPDSSRSPDTRGAPTPTPAAVARRPGTDRRRCHGLPALPEAREEARAGTGARGEAEAEAAAAAEAQAEARSLARLAAVRQQPGAHPLHG